MVTDVSYDAFLARAKELSSVITENIQADSFFTVMSHHDADGLSSASVIGSALSRARARFTIRIVEELREDILDEISKAEPEVAIFTDIGSGYFDVLSTHLKAKTNLVLDHHPPSAQVPKNIVQLNPHDFGIDGARLVSASGLCYFVARELSEQNKDLSAMAIVGALGDMQDRNDKRALTGLNEPIVEDAVASENVRVDSDLVLYGRETRPIHRALAYTTTPYLPNLSGREDNCLTLLSTNSIRLKEGDRFRTIADLSQDEKQKLLNAIISYLTSIGFQSSVVLDMVGTVYTLVNEPGGSPTRDAREFSALLNACGRSGSVLVWEIGKQHWKRPMTWSPATGKLLPVTWNG
jgi:single-stranded-DNA-specific exonuclease